MTLGPDLDDLRSTLREQASAMPDNVDREHEVQDRVARHRRRRTVAGSVTAVVVVAAASVLAVNVLPTSDSSPDDQHPPVGSHSATPSATEALPTYLRGGKLIASKEAADPHGITMTFTATSLEFGFVVSCGNPTLAKESRPPRSDFAYLRVNGRGVSGTSCGSSLGLGGDADFGRDGVGAGAKYGVVVGQPVTVRLAFGSGGTHPGTQWRIGVYQRVPLVDYPFPSRPDRLQPLDIGLRYPGLGHLKVWTTRGSGVCCGGASFPVHHGLTFRTGAVVPGALRMYVDGHLVTTAYSWTYDLEQFEASFTLQELGIRSGQWVNVRVTWDPFTTEREVPGSVAYRVYDSAGPR